MAEWIKESSIIYFVQEIHANFKSIYSIKLNDWKKDTP